LSKKEIRSVDGLKGHGYSTPLAISGLTRFAATIFDNLKKSKWHLNCVFKARAILAEALSDIVIVLADSWPTGRESLWPST